MTLELKVGQLVEWQDRVLHNGRSATRTLQGRIVAIEYDAVTIEKATGNMLVLQASAIRRIVKDVDSE